MEPLRALTLPKAAWRLKMEPWRDLRPDTDLDPHKSEKFDPEPNQNEKRDPSG
jgi:hypothetical protein